MSKELHALLGLLLLYGGGRALIALGLFDFETLTLLFVCFILARNVVYEDIKEDG